jgi:hypothetical protein
MLSNSYSLQSNKFVSLIYINMLHTMYITSKEISLREMNILNSAYI